MKRRKPAAKSRTKSANGRKPKKPAAPGRVTREELHPIGQLSPADLERVLRRKHLVAEANATASLMRDGYAKLWETLQDRYEVPADVRLNESTGDLYAAEVPRG